MRALLSSSSAAMIEAVGNRGGRRYGAIVWESGLEINDAIVAAKAFPDANGAYRYIAPLCGAAERWAVVDLATMTVIAEGGCRAHAPVVA